MKPSPTLVWSAATLMVTIVSAFSLIGVSIMPLISGPSYKIFITLFTGLAVGSLLGSAIFSLIPQAFSLHLSADKAYLWKSLVIFFGVYLFYISERLMRIYFDRKTKQKQQQEHIYLDKKESSKLTSTTQDVTNDTSGGDHVPGPSSVDKKHEQDNQENYELMTEISLNKDEKVTNTGKSKGHHHHHHHGLKPIKSEDDDGVQGGLSGKKNIAPVAWMIIIGDGLHNFIDGLSIGAAFSESIVLGVSTSVAVIFEEFPHELGDFAVLISSGMTVKQALGFNFLSACTCYLGMIFGILLGDLTSSASYIFALAGGMFLYISLVDMMGELSNILEESRHSIKETSRLLVMQNLGILTGIIIIFTLSLISN